MAEPATPILGQTEAGAPLAVDLDRLIGSHACLVANSGGGKSGLIRKLLEVTHGRVQHLVLDVEDEFYTLRERFDYVIAGGEGGDVPASPDNAAALARGALEHGFSLIAQLNDLGPEGAAAFVARFIEALIHAPRELWRPALVVLDEAQRFAPSGGRNTGEARMVRALTAQGRKRGFTAVLASQRIAKLDPDVRGDVNNWLIGRVGQALDRNTMADQLGLGPKEGRDALQAMSPREFWAFGPALAPAPVLFRTADVATTPVRPGQAKLATPPAPEALRAILAGLAAPADAGASPSDTIPADPVAAFGKGGEVGTLLRARNARIAALEADVAKLRRERDLLVNRAERYGKIAGALDYQFDRIKEAVAAADAVWVRAARAQESRAKPGDEAKPEAGAVEPGSRLAAGRTAAATSEIMDVTAGETAPDRAGDDDREFRALAGLAAVWPAGLSEAAWAARTGYSRKGGAWLRRRKRYLEAVLVEQRAQPGGSVRWFATEAGVARAAGEVPELPPPGPALVAWWAQRFDAAGRLLKVLAEVHPRALTRDALAAELSMAPKGGAFLRHVAALKRAELVSEHGKRLALAPDLLGVAA